MGYSAALGANPACARSAANTTRIGHGMTHGIDTAPGIYCLRRVQETAADPDLAH
jgi:hypothetical protein